MIEYTEATIVPNKINPAKDPWLSLGYKNNNRKCDLIFGNKKAYLVMAEFDKIKESFENNKGKMFSYTLDIDAGTKFASQFIITEPMFNLIAHYKDDIASYLNEHPYVPFHRTAITEPIVKSEINGLEYTNVLYLPCYEKKEGDEGEGLIPRKISQKTATFFVGKAFGGKAFVEFNKAIKENKSELVDKFVSRTGEEYETPYSLEVMKCYVKYKTTIMEFALSGTISND